MADKAISLGNVGSLDINFSAGVAKVTLALSVPGSVGVSGGAFVECDSSLLVSAIFAAIEAKLPAGTAPIAEEAKSIIINAVKAIQ